MFYNFTFYVNAHRCVRTSCACIYVATYVYISIIIFNFIAIQGRMNELVELLPTNCYSTVCKLRKMTNFTDVDEKMSDILSECDDARVINNQLLSYIIKKCAGNVVLLCDVLKNVVSTDKKEQLQDLGMVIYQTAI